MNHFKLIKGSGGITITEIIVVIAILLIVAMIAVPAMAPGDMAVLRTSARELAADINAARQFAVTRRTNSSVGFNNDNTYTVPGDNGTDTIKKFNTNIHVTGTNLIDGNRIQFISTGKMQNPGTVVLTLSYSGKTSAVTVYISTGKAVVTDG